MKEEFHSLQKNDKWELVTLPPGRKLVKCKWVFKNKFYVDCNPMKYKEILLGSKLSQFQGIGIDYNDNFAPAVNMNFVRLVLAIAASK